MQKTFVALLFFLEGKKPSLLAKEFDYFEMGTNL
jgi:hypothetical protein|tara:strand:- start:33 stop:134 length:102 start_codon:yes stop_codon:yes gene_type:complete